MGVGSEGKGRGAWSLPPRIFIHVTDKVEGGLMMLFFGLVFFLLATLAIFLPTSLGIIITLQACSKVMLTRCKRFMKFLPRKSNQSSNYRKCCTVLWVIFKRSGSVTSDRE